MDSIRSLVTGYNSFSSFQIKEKMGWKEVALYISMVAMSVFLSVCVGNYLAKCDFILNLFPRSLDRAHNLGSHLNPENNSSLQDSANPSKKNSSLQGSANPPENNLSPEDSGNIKDESAHSSPFTHLKRVEFETNGKMQPFYNLLELKQDSTFDPTCWLEYLKKFDKLGIAYIQIQSFSGRMDGCIKPIIEEFVKREPDQLKRFIVYITVRCGERAPPILGGREVFIKQAENEIKEKTSVPIFIFGVRKYKSNIEEFSSFGDLERNIKAYREAVRENKSLLPEVIEVRSNPHRLT